MNNFPITQRNRVRRHRERGHYDKETIYAIIDEAMFCHVGFVHDGRPVVIPFSHARRGDELLIHGSAASRLIRHIQAGHEVSVSIAILDALVLAKTAYNQSVNYRSVVLFGRGRLLEGEEKVQGLAHITNKLIPGQWDYVRKPTPNELKATGVVAISIEEASAKIRNAPPGDDGEDRELPLWAGLLPVKQVVMEPVTADYTAENIPVPPHVRQMVDTCE